MMLIESPSNPFIKEAAALHQRKHRESKGVILVEGLHPLEEAAKAGLAIYQLFILQGQELSLPPLPDTIHIEVSKRVMAKLATTDSPPVCVATVERPPSPDLSAFTASKSLLVVLDQIQDPGNLGTLIRSSRAFGADAAILTAGSVDPYNPKVIRGSAGLVFALPLIQPQCPLPELLSKLGDAACKIYATTGSAHAKRYREVSYDGLCAIVLGNEGAGLSQQLPEHLDNEEMQWVTIPMANGVDSLNVAISGSILLAEAAASRSRKTSSPQKQQA